MKQRKRRFSDPNFSLITGPFVQYQKVSAPLPNTSLINGSMLLPPSGYSSYSSWLKNLFSVKLGGPPPGGANSDYDTVTFLMDMDGGGGLCFHDLFQRHNNNSANNAK